jgi:hypothetical protein
MLRSIRDDGLAKEINQLCVSRYPHAGNFQHLEIRPVSSNKSVPPYRMRKASTRVLVGETLAEEVARLEISCPCASTGVL